MVALTLLRIMEPSPLMVMIYIFIIKILFLLGGVYLAARSGLILVERVRERKRNNILISYLRESSELSSEISEWIKGHREEIEEDSIKTLNNPELLSLIQQAQELDDVIITFDPALKGKVISPKEFHRHLLEVAEGKYKQTH